MANYAAVKALIDSQVKQNGVNAITGNILNGVLNEMVDVLGQGFQFMGVAHIDDTPTVDDDSKLAYLAGPGTYADFGGVVVPDLSVAILKYDGSWSVQSSQIVDLSDYYTKDQVDTEIADAIVNPPYIDEDTGDWFTWDKYQNKYVNSGVHAQGPQGERGPAGVTSVIVEVSESTGTPSATASVDNGVLTITFSGLKGETGNGIQSVVQTTSSQESGGENVITVTMTDGTVATFSVRNGQQGAQGIQGVPGVANAKYKQVDSLPTASADTMGYIYLTPSGTSGVYNMSYTEQNGSTYTWKDLGTTAIQLSDYATKEEVNQLGQQATRGYDEETKTPTSVGHLNIDGSADKFSYSSSGSVYVYYVPISKGQHILYTATNGSAQTFRYAFSQSVPAQDVLATGVYRGSESSVDIDIESPVNGYFAVYHSGSYFTDQVFKVGTPTTILSKINTIENGTAKADAFVDGSTEDKASSFVSGFYNMTGKSVGDNIQTSMNTSDDLETAVLDIKPGQVLLSNTSLVTSSSVAHAVITDAGKIVSFPTTQRINEGLVLTAEEISSGATKVIVVYRISIQFFAITLYLSNNYKSLDGRISNLETDIVKADNFMEGSVENNSSAWASGYYNMNSKTIGGKKASSKTSSTDLMTAILPISKGVVVQSNTMLVTSTSVKHAVLTDDDTIVSFPTTQRINDGLSLTDAEILAGGSRLLVVYRISIQDVQISLTSSYGFAYIKANLQSGGLMKGKTVILCGDSQLGQAQEVDEMIQEIVGGNILNCGFGGCRMSWRTNNGSDPYDAFTMINVADCLVSGDFSTMLAQTEIIASYPYFADAIAKLQSVSMADGKDIVLTIAYGGNDFSGDASIGSLDTETKTTYLGALAYCVRVLLTAFPRLSILLVGLPYRVYEYETDPDTGEKTITSDSDTYVKTSGLHRYDFNDALLDAGKTLKLPGFDMYRRSGRNKFNVFALCPDGTHPTTIAGKQAEAELYAKILQTF